MNDKFLRSKALEAFWTSAVMIILFTVHYTWSHGV
jgi:hypothetical protein